MRYANVLLFSNDSTLAKCVRTSLAHDPSCDLVVESDPIQAISLIRGTPIELLLVHSTAGEGFQETISFLKAISTPTGLLATVVISDSADAAESAQFIDCGVIECLHTPLDVRRLSNLVTTLTSRQRLVQDQKRAFTEVARKRSLCVAELSMDDSKSKFLFNTSGEFAELMEQVRRVAPSMTSVLLLGETGVGKTCLANLIHKLSPRRSEPFVAVNCGALSPGLIESELLGHVKGSFTGAMRDHDGKMKLAGRGTLLLDEIDSLPLIAQASLLRAIDERVFEPVGSSCSERFEARLIVATNRDLAAEVEARRFREDLYYRINVISFRLPPLRDRRELIRGLAEQFLTEFAERDGRPVPELSEESLKTLLSYDWPGNIRELRNVIERASSLCRDEVIFSNDLWMNQGRLTSNGRSMEATRPDRKHWIHQREDSELKVIQRALAIANNNRAKAARDLGMSRVTLYKKLHKYNLLDSE